MTVTILLVFISAFITDILGGRTYRYHGDSFLTHPLVHRVVSGFLAELVIPRESSFVIALVEKLEDLVSLLFLPVVRHLLVVRQGVC